MINLNISIHAPLTGCDSFRQLLKIRYSDFNPRTPDGVRLKRAGFCFIAFIFQSTHP